MARSVSVFWLFLALTWASGPAQAIAVLDLRSGGCHEQIDCTLALSGGGHDATLAHLTAPRVSFGADDFFAYSDGMIFGNGVFPHSFDLSFDRSVLWLGGALDLSHGFTGFDILGPSLKVSGVLKDTTQGVFILENPLLFQADQTYSFRTTLAPSFTFGVIGQFDFAGITTDSSPSVVPVPATLPLMLSLLAGFALIRFKWVRGSGSDHRHRRPDHAIA